MRDHAIVGRRSELDRLADCLARRAGAVVVVGEAGVGKTRLVDEFGAHVVATHRVVRGRADEHERVAFGLWLAPLRQLALPRPGSDPSIPTSELRWEVVDVLVSGLRAAGPALVVLDDLHWADDDSLWVLEQVLDRRLDSPLTIVATSRPASEARSDRWSGVCRRSDQLMLAGLAVDECAALVAQLGAPPVDVVGVWRRTGGNPLFVRELVLHPDGRPAVTAVDLLAAALDRAGRDVADFVSVLALAGPATPEDVLAAAAGVLGDDLEDLVTRARRADLLSADDVLRIRHDLLVEAAIERCGAADRRRVHRALADAWARRVGLDAAVAAARHQVLAVPTVDPSSAATATLAVADQLMVDRRAADAAALVQASRSVLDPRADVAARFKARLALAEADARWALDDLDAAASVAAEAATYAAGAGDPVLAATAEVAAATHHPIFPEPTRAQRLAEVDAALPASHDAVDPALRIRLRGRRAVVTMSFPERLDEAIALADGAINAARRLGEPDVLAQALTDRYFVLATPSDFDARDRAAEELIELSGTARSATTARWGHEWRYAASLGRGDLRGALAAAADLETQAAIMPSPFWRWSAALRRCGLLALLGDYAGALGLVGAVRNLAAGVVPVPEAVGTEFGMRMNVAVLYGRRDHGGDDIAHLAVGFADPVPLLFFQAQVALSEIVAGDLADARRRLTPWLGRFDTALRGIEGLATLGALAHAAVLLGWAEAAGELRTLLQPFAGRLAGANSVLIDVAVDHHLAALALLDGDLAAARAHGAAAVAFARRLGSPPVEARTLGLLAEVLVRTGDTASAAAAREAAVAIAEPLGMQLPGAPARGHRTAQASAPQQPSGACGRTGALRRDRDRWIIDSPYGTGNVADSVGMTPLARLLAAPAVDFAAVDLAGARGGGELLVNRDLGPALDARAKREYRQRIAELHADIDEADEHHDIERAARHRAELDALLDGLRAAVGLGGRDRPQGSGSERARINVTRGVRRAIAAIAAAVPDLGAHLDVSVRTGHHCSYSPEPAARITWYVQT